VSRPIWEYRSNTAAVPVLRDVFAGKRCPCCVETSLLAPSDASSEYDPRRYTEERRALACALCGWWFAYSEAYDSSCGSTPDFAVHVVSATGAALETYAFPDHQALAVLGDEIDRHMTGAGSSTAWAAMEDATAAVLRSFGYNVRATARSKDGGVDMVLDHRSDASVFVQVKHSKNKVGVGVIRELIGTMVLEGAHKGLLVTSSSFTEAATDLRDASGLRGFALELVDGERFLSALRLTARLEAPTLAEIFAVAGPPVTLIQEEVHV